MNAMVVEICVGVVYIIVGSLHHYAMKTVMLFFFCLFFIGDHIRTHGLMWNVRSFTFELTDYLHFTLRAMFFLPYIALHRL